MNISEEYFNRIFVTNIPLSDEDTAKYLGMLLEVTLSS